MRSLAAACCAMPLPLQQLGSLQQATLSTCGGMRKGSPMRPLPLKSLPRLFGTKVGASHLEGLSSLSLYLYKSLSFSLYLSISLSHTLSLSLSLSLCLSVSLSLSIYICCCVQFRGAFFSPIGSKMRFFFVHMERMKMKKKPFFHPVKGEQL